MEVRTLRVMLLVFIGVAAAQTPPGKLVDAGGYRVHLYCTGEGSPTVVIVGAGFSFDWTLVQTEVAKFTRVCSYDPAGTAWSDPAPEPGRGSTCASRVDEIHKLGVKGPYVLTGLSVGALVARLYARKYPAEVAGMVIVDHAFIDIGAHPASAAHAGGLDSPPAILEMTPIVVTPEDDPGFASLPEPVRKLHRWAASLNPVLPTVEIARECIAQLGQASLGDMPLAVVSTANDSPGYPELQAQLLALSRNSRQFIAARSFHSVEMSEPDVIVAAIRAVLNKRRQP